MKAVVLAGWAAKGLIILLSLLNARLLIEIVGVDGFAAHSIIVSLTAWLALLDLGASMAVQNLISKYRVEKRDYLSLKNTAFSGLIVLFAVFLPFVLAMAVAVRHFLLTSYLFVDTVAVFFACVALLLSGLGQIFNRILYAEHRAFWPNSYPALNAFGVCVCLLLLKLAEIRSFNVVLVAFFLPNLLIFWLGALQLGAFRKWSLDTTHLREIWHECRGFALFATLSTCTLAVDYLIMARLLVAQDIAQYNLASRLFMAVLSVHAVVLATAWSVTSELLHGQRWHEARRYVLRILRLGLVLGVIAGVALLLLADQIIPILSAGKVGAIPTVILLAWFAYSLIRVWSDTFGMGLFCFSKTAPLNMYIPFQAILSVLGQYVLGSMFGLVGIVLGLIASFLLTSAWVAPWQFFKMTRGTA